MVFAIKLLSNKKAQGMMGGPRKPISLLMGLVFLAFGGIPLLNQFGLIEFSIPAIVGMPLNIISIAGAVFLLWDALSENMAMMGLSQMLRMATFVTALVLLAVGLIPLLHSMQVIGFNIEGIAATIFNVLYVLTGGLLIYGGSQGF